MADIKIYAFADEADEMFDGQIEALLKNDLQGIEIRGVDGTNISDITLEKAREIKEKLDQNGLVCWSIGSPIGKIDIEKDDFEAHIEKFKHTLELAKILGAFNMRIFSFFMPEGKNPDDYREEVIKRLNILCDIAKDYGVTLCHENEKGIYGDNIERCLDIFQNVKGIKGIFDPANFVQSEVDTLVAWDALKNNIKYMHIKDSLKDGNVVPAGKGDGNIPFIANEFIKMGGKDFTLEPHLMDFAGLKGLEREGDTSEVGKIFTFKDNKEAFCAAADAFKALI